jgi:hypothetical protein
MTVMTGDGSLSHFLSDGFVPKNQSPVTIWGMVDANNSAKKLDEKMATE